MAQKSVLGKGLGSLLPGAGATYHPAKVPPEAPEEKKIEASPEPVEIKKEEVKKEAKPVDGGIITSTNKDRIPGISMTLIDSIIVNPFQPRREFDPKAIEELSQSIQENGLIQPLVVRKVDKGYELIAGERRFRASKKAGLKQVPIVIRKTTDREMLELALIENIQREDLNCVEVSLAYFQLSQEFNLTQEEISKKVGKDRASVANYMRLLRLPEVVLESLKKDELSFGHGKALMALDDADDKVKVWKTAVEEKLSVRATEDVVSEIKEKKAATSSGPTSLKDEARRSQSTMGARFRSMGRDLTRTWGTRVQVKGNDKKGKFVVHFNSREELDRLIEMMQSVQNSGPENTNSL